ncbi:interleukin-12 receptor subunit beta-2 [Hippocampus comes]|uniref:interleukin-12 receptor subunit beta-2 n=1 Tax=Hippocampus comes TaxID=109280 RepID=UPI00094F1098|nr:PREDICTED: interleukin-12 receptor subunit beta-2-like [Hippocampus comes]
MATIPTARFLVCAALLMRLAQVALGETSACVIWSSAGAVVRRGSSLDVYCAFHCECERAMLSEHPPALQRHTVVNSTTTSIRVENITKHRTFSCLCHGMDLDPCGFDIWAGYPPERPRDIRCKQKVLSNLTGEVICSWERGRKTHLRDTSELVWVSTSVSGDPTESWPPIKIFIGASDPPMARFSVRHRVQFISVRVSTHNALGSAVSLPANYTLSNIAIPEAPVLAVPRCSSRGCALRVQSPQRTQYLEIQYATEAGLWTTYPNSGVPVDSDQLLSIWSLEPYRLYRFRARAKFSSGLWSNWSNVASSWTQEEAPAKELDVWYTQPPFDFKSIRLFWKPMTAAHARGKILAYLVAVHGSQSVPVSTSNLSANATGASVAFCAGCHVTVSALNAKGTSPPAKIVAYRAKASAHLDVTVKAHEHGVALLWRQAQRAASHVVEWYPEGLKLQELHWLKLSGEDSRAVITGLNASECYEGAVYVLYSDGSMTTSTFRLLNTSRSVPKAGPSFQQEVDASRVTLTWAELPRVQRGGCITQYTIYLEDANGSVQQYSVQATRRRFVLEDLPPGAHSLWMTAWTSQGESPATRKVKIIIQAVEGIPVLLLVLCPLLSVGVSLLLCLCQIAAVKKRVWLLFQCFMLQMVPDPANSKWAKECTQDKGKMKLHSRQSESVLTEEEEPDIIIIITDEEELSNHNTEGAASTPTSPSASRRPLTTYIKSVSIESDGPEQTRTLLNSKTKTVDYISAGCQDGRLVEEEVDGDDEDEFGHMLTPLPACCLFNERMEPQIIGKLTLDAVRIDCSSLFENC